MSLEPAYPDIGRLPVVDGKPLFWQELQLYSGLIPVLTEPLAARPVLHFKGGKIGKPMWEQIISFLLWTQEKFKAESQVRLFYHSARKEWRVVVAPQEAFGLSVKELEHHPDKEAAYAEAENEGFFCMGTVHHHCTIGAFMSGTDRNDEQKQNGLHITVGKLDQPVLDLHARASLRGVLFGVSWSEWFDFPEAELSIPVIGKHPVAWEGRMIPRPEPAYHRGQKWQSRDGWIVPPDHGRGSRDTIFVRHWEQGTAVHNRSIQECPVCFGMGYDGEHSCARCQGSGWVVGVVEAPAAVAGSPAAQPIATQAPSAHPALVAKAERTASALGLQNYDVPQTLGEVEDLVDVLHKDSSAMTRLVWHLYQVAEELGVDVLTTRAMLSEFMDALSGSDLDDLANGGSLNAPISVLEAQMLERIERNTQQEEEQPDTP